MEHIDDARATRIWQRVQAAPNAATLADSLPALICQEWEIAGVFQQLARRLGGKEASALRRLAEAKLAQAACLKGIYALMTGEQFHPQLSPESLRSSLQALRRCYGKQMRCLAQYEACSAEPEYGPAFNRLAAREQEHCAALLELIGRLKPPSSKNL